MLKRIPKFPWEDGYKDTVVCEPLLCKCAQSSGQTSILDKMFHLVKNARILPYTKSTIQFFGWSLPSHGVSYPDCGLVKAKGCNHVFEHPEAKVFVRYYKASCMRKSCPVCFEDWAYAEAFRSLCRISAYVLGADFVENLLAKSKARFRHKNPHYFYDRVIFDLEHHLQRSNLKVKHVVVSPDPNSKFDKKSFRKLRNKAYRIAKKSGLKGGIMVFHPSRLHCEKCGLAIPDYADACVCGCQSFVWVASPHFHVVGFGWIEDTADLYARSGWVVKNLGIRRSVYHTIAYLMSHAGVYEDPEPAIYKKDIVRFHAVTWFGRLSYNKLSFRFPEPMKAVCPYCGANLRPCEFRGNLDRPPPDFDEEHIDNNDFLDDLVRWNFR
jgi:hypothetical protein